MWNVTAGMYGITRGDIWENWLPLADCADEMFKVRPVPEASLLGPVV